MKSLSYQSLSFLKEIKKHSPSEQADPTWKLHYTRLFCDLYDVIRSVHESLNDLNTGRWAISYDGNNDQDELSFCFSLNLSEDDFLPKIKIYINPFGESSIEIPKIDSKRLQEKMEKSLESFYPTAAYKRYFAQHENENVGLKTVIPVKQITSSHLDDYLTHLIKMMNPYLTALIALKTFTTKAA